MNEVTDREDSNTMKTIPWTKEDQDIREYVRALEERVMQLEAVVLKLTTQVPGYAIDYANCGEHKR